MINQILILLLCAISLLFIIMTLVWLWQLKSKNAGIVDVVWAFSFPLSCLLYYFVAGISTNRNLVLLFMVILWGGRLGIYLFLRNWGHEEDARYTNLRNEWGAKANLKMFLFFQFQALLAVLLSLPFALVFIDHENSFSVLEITGLILWTAGLIGESIADAQLKAFKKNPLNKGRVCDSGLWFYSRHPNYFFEWLIWVAYFVFAFAVPYGWLSIYCPVLMYHFLVNVTGIKYTEEHMLATRGEVFAKYQRETSAFFPWFKNK